MALRLTEKNALFHCRESEGVPGNNPQASSEDEMSDKRK